MGEARTNSITLSGDRVTGRQTGFLGDSLKKDFSL